MSDLTPPLRSNVVGGIIHPNGTISAGKQNHCERRSYHLHRTPLEAPWQRQQTIMKSW